MPRRVRCNPSVDELPRLLPSSGVLTPLTFISTKDVLVVLCELTNSDKYGREYYQSWIMSARKGPFRLVTVNTAPERAKRLIGRLIDALKEDYEIIYVDNCENIDQVVPKVTEHRPNVLFCASMWTPEEAEEIQGLARTIVPDIKTHAIPSGLQVERGPDAIVDYLVENVPPLLDS